MGLESELRSVGFVLEDGRMAVVTAFLLAEDFDSIWDLQGLLCFFAQTPAPLQAACRGRGPAEPWRFGRDQ